MTRRDVGERAVHSALRKAASAWEMARWFANPRSNPGFLIVTYHRILEQCDPYDARGVVRRSVFENQLRMLKRCCAVLPLPEVIDRIDRGAPLPRRCVALTFDDGYRDFSTLAWPLLRRYRLPATLFVTVQALERGFLWPDLLRHAIRHTKATHVTLKTLEATGPWTARLTNQAERLQAVQQLSARLKVLRHDEKENVLQALVDNLFDDRGSPDASLPSRLTLSWQELETLVSEGLDIGAHTMTHPSLAYLPEHEAAEEIRLSRQVLEQRLGKPIAHFCYPHGTASDVSPQVQRLVQAAGFRSACTTLNGINRCSTDRFLLKRIDANQRAWNLLVQVAR